jgi:membrane protease subunit HflC
VRRNLLIGGLVGAFVLGLIVANAFFVVDQSRQAIVLRFGRPVAVVNATGKDDPGLKLKAPLVERVVLLDKRNQALDAGQTEVVAQDQQHLVVSAFLRYRITDPLQYYRTLADEGTAHDRLERLVNASLRQVLGTASSAEIISGRREALMALARDEIAAQARAAQLGVEVIDLRIKRVGLPDTDRAVVIKRMQTARQQQAAQITADGDQQKEAIIADADKEVAVIQAAADADAERIRSQGEAKRAAIFAASFERDPKFAAFYQSMRAYEAGLGQGDTTLVLSPDGDFFKYLKKGPAK